MIGRIKLKIKAAVKARLPCLGKFAMEFSVVDVVRIQRSQRGEALCIIVLFYIHLYE